MVKTLVGLGIAGLAALGVAPMASADTTVNPTPPTFVDTCGTANDTYTIPAQKGVSYFVGGVKMSNGVRHIDAGSPTVTIFPVADPGYTLAQNGSWSHTFDTSSASDGTGCASASPTSSAAAATPSASSSPSSITATGKPAVTAGPSTDAATTPQTGKTLPHTGINTESMIVDGGMAIVIGAGIMGGSGYSLKRRSR